MRKAERTSYEGIDALKDKDTGAFETRRDI